MNRSILIVLLLLFSFIAMLSCKKATDNSYWNSGQELLEVQRIYEKGQHPNVVVAMDGSLIATYGKESYHIRRSEDGGETWGAALTLADPGWQGGGTIVDENTGDILVFTEEKHPPAPLHVFRSKDNGLNWIEEEVKIHPDKNGNMPSMHMNETGITLKNGPHAGRLIRPTRFYGEGNDREYWPSHYTNAIYSDDEGKTWYTSAPFPAKGTGEAALAELSDGTIYYNSRRHLSTDGLNPRMRHIAWSYDGGETWKDLSVSEVLPDGPQDHDYGLMGGLVRLRVDGHDILLFSNVDVPVEVDVSFEERTNRRKNGTIWASFDGGKTWPVKRLIREGSFAYSSLAAGREGTASEGWIYLMFEAREPGQPGLGYIARFNLNWVTQGRNWKEFLPK